MYYQHKKLLLFLIFLTILIACAFQGSRGLYESTEGRYAECARESLKTGDLDDPVLDGESHWTKPPLTYYCIAGGIKLLGRNDWGARAYLSIAFILTVMAIYYLAAQLWDRETAFFSALIYATSPFTVIAENVVTPDTLLVFWQALSMLFFWLAVRRKQQVYILLMWLSLGLAHLTKGPPALLPLFGIIPIYFVLKRKDSFIPNIFNFLGVIIFIITGFAWYFIEAREPGNSNLMHYWIFDEVLGRNLRGEFKRNPEFYKGFLIYLPILFLGTGQWIIILFSKLKDILRSRKEWFRWDDGAEKIKWIYLILSFFIPLAVFFLSKSKYPLYMLPLFVPLSVAMGKIVSWLVSQNKVRLKTILSVACCSALLFIIVKAGSAKFESNKDMKALFNKVNVLAKSYPRYIVYNVGHSPLNGLQFYLDESVPLITQEELPGTLENNRLAEITPIVLVRKKILDKTIVNVDLTHYRIKQLNRYWAAIIPAS